jgi:hypothetical protein
MRHPCPALVRPLGTAAHTTATGGLLPTCRRPPLARCLSLLASLTHTHTRACTCARTRARARPHPHLHPRPRSQPAIPCSDLPSDAWPIGEVSRPRKPLLLAGLPPPAPRLLPLPPPRLLPLPSRRTRCTRCPKPALHIIGHPVHWAETLLALRMLLRAV